MCPNDLFFLFCGKKLRTIPCINDSNQTPIEMSSQHLAKALKKDNDETATWAISGRSEAKLRKVLAEASEATGLDLKDVPLIICDINDEESIRSMAASAKVELYMRLSILVEF